MAALAAAVLPFAGGVPRRCAATAPCDASERASEKKKPPRIAPARDPSVCLAGGVEELYVPSQKRKVTCDRNHVETAADVKVSISTVGGEMASARELLQKRLASELDALRGLLKRAEIISRRGPCKGDGGAPTAGKKERFLAPKQRAEPKKDGGGNAASVKRTKISALAEQKQRQIRAPRMSPEERSQLAGRLSSLSGELPCHIVEFLLKQFGDADDTRGEIEINIDSVEDSVLFELKNQLDKFARERPIVVVDVLPVRKDEKVAEERKTKGILVEKEEEDVHNCGVSTIVQAGSRPSSRSSSSDTDTVGDSACKRYSDEFPALREALPEQIIATSAQPPPEPASGTAARSGEAKKAENVQRAAPKAVYMPGLIYRAKVRRELLEMERAALPDESIHRRDLQSLGIAEYGHPSLMRQLGLFLKADDA